jgi:hypothetical protein
MEIRKGYPSPCARAGRQRPGVSILGFFLSSLTLALIVGCAAPGEPITRHAPAPTPVTDLSARQIGSRVFIAFALPAKTTDHKPLGSTPSVEVYWGFFAANAPAPNAASIEKQNAVIRVPSAIVGQYASAGHIRFPVEMKPEDLEHQFGAQAAFVVNTRISDRRTSDPSNVAVVRVFPPPAPIADLAAKVTQEAVELSWSPISAPTVPGNPASTSPPVSYRIYRAEKRETKAAPNATAVNASPSELLGETPTPAFRDTNFEFGHNYTYSVRSLVHYGATPAESVESDDSNLFALSPKDTFPPAAPIGLVAVVVPASSDVPAHIELSWSISPETDLAGYNVYRNEQASAPVPRLNVSTLLVPSYRDMTVTPGRIYNYTVTAVDRAGNESPASEPVTVGITAAEKGSNP